MTDPESASEGIEPAANPRSIVGITRLEWGAMALAIVVLAALTIAEPDILEAPFENNRTLIFTFGGTALAAVALVAMLRFRVQPVIRLLVLGVPFVAVSWWLLSPFFVDDVVDDEFTTSIADATQPAADQPRLLGAGLFVGLAGHDGTGDAGFFALEDERVVLRLENLDVENGPDLRLYVLPGDGRTEPGDDSLNLGALRGNVGDQTYDLPADFALTPGDWTVLVWCEAFSVEFVAATVTIA